ncbi:PD-(D/E)XK nuclease family protein [Sphingobium sp.]|uniref:RecB family exonuclease n=1 Tax=Sphingobium sp. TaxID=1912891 RepID=UPI002609C094|nr:PD-(D/E)XK nuclease family protein [Sphingobium sp.]
MQIVFGLWADGGAYPDHGGGANGALGQPVVGPIGLLDILETTLGIGGPLSSQVVRIARFQASLEMLADSHFWTRSLAVDPWSTARTLLGWRDELIGLGWCDTEAWTSPRLRDLATASQTASDLPAGLEDRIQVILAELAAANRAPLPHIRMIDALDVCPASLRRLVTRLEELGCVIEEITPAPSATAETALGKLQRWILGQETTLEGADTTVTAATASSGTLAAEIVGQWFALQENADVALIAQGGDTDLLDHGLSGSAQPRAGRSQRSVHRGSLQLLLLAFKSAWAPFDPRALMEILVFPGSPVAGHAARRLAAALEDAPGRGGPEWGEAWDDIAVAATGYGEAKGDSPQKIASRLARWRSWAEPTIADPVAGMPIAQALGICDATIAWAGARYATTDDQLYAATTKLASEVRAALAALGRDRLPRLLIERIIDQALDLGQPNPNARAEAASWRGVSSPGAVWAPVSTVLWWNFTATTEGSVRSPWTEQEREELTAAGCAPDAVTLAPQAASAAWERAVLNARDRVIFVGTGLACEADETMHPLAHRLKPALDKLGNRVSLESALTQPALEFAGASLARQPITPSAIAEPRAAWATPAGFEERLADHHESASSLESLLSCQLMWALRHVARLRPGRVRAIPDGNQLLGNLAHAIAREVFPPGAPPQPEDAESHANTLLEARIDQLAAPLRHPELAEELNLARRRIPRAMGALARCLIDNDLVVEATEQQVSGTFESLLALRGAVDLVARDPAGNAVIVDLKWTRSDRTRVDEISTGRAVQLATYGALIADDHPYRAGYFLLSQRQFLTLADNNLVGRPIDGVRSFPETWATIVDAWKRWRGAAGDGQLLAMGVAGAADLVPAEIAIARDVHCNWCDYATLCRVRGLA